MCKSKENNQRTISILLPCLNEQDSVEACIDNAQEFLSQTKMAGEIIIIDNGSTDNTKEIALRKNAIVFDEPSPGYGNTLRRGLSGASGDFIFMMDCDSTYNLLDAKTFLHRLTQKHDFVIGSRLRGKIYKKAMPWAHHVIGVPFLTWLVKTITNYEITDAHCGLRAIRKDALQKINLSCEGMEFASEMILEAALAELYVSEVPISYMPRVGTSKLKTFQDGFRHLTLIVSYIPRLLK